MIIKMNLDKIIVRIIAFNLLVGCNTQPVDRQDSYDKTLELLDEDPVQNEEYVQSNSTATRSNIKWKPEQQYLEYNITGKITKVDSFNTVYLKTFTVQEGDWQNIKTILFYK